MPCGQLQEHQAEREQIRARIQRLEEERFGRGVEGVPLGMGHRGLHPARQLRAGEGEVRQGDAPIGAQVDAPRAHVAVDDAERLASLVHARMGVVERAGHLGPHVEREGLGQARLAYHGGADEGAQRRARDELGQDVQHALGLAAPEDAGDVGVIEVGGQTHLLLQPGADPGVGLGIVARRVRWQAADDHLPLGAQPRAPPGEHDLLAVVGEILVADELIGELTLREEDHAQGIPRTFRGGHEEQPT